MEVEKEKEYLNEDNKADWLHDLGKVVRIQKRDYRVEKYEEEKCLCYETYTESH